MTESFVCPYCGNRDEHSIGFLNGKPYCRLCISFRGEEAEAGEGVPKISSLFVPYQLSSEQIELSEKLLANCKSGIDSLVYAVTGSGKTEICLKLIDYCIKNGLKVGFAVPRKSVCYELKVRFQNYFRKNSIIAVFGGHHDRLDADIICLTTHQLFRYKDYFDLLILDEIDAFPFKGNKVLKQFFLNSIKRNYVLLTATPSEQLVEAFSKNGREVLRLPIRFHRHPLPVPKLVTGGRLSLHYKLILILRKFIKQNKQVFIFVPTIDESKQLAFFLRLFCRGGTYVNSQRSDNEIVIDDFRKRKYKYLVTTAVLERGVTIKDLQVIVFHADNVIYDAASLVQISGRAGRKKEAPEGEVIFYAKKNNKHIQKAIDDIRANNKLLQDMLQKDTN